MNEIKVSVIIPVYNMQKYISECLDSVLNQTLKDIEIIVINDGSTDNSLQILNDYSRQDNRIILINKENEGVWAARNDGIKRAQGEYISFLDSDDMFSNSNVLKKLYTAAENNNVNICGGRLERLLTDGSIIKDENKVVVGNVSFFARGLTKYSDYQYDYGYWCFIYKRKLLLNEHIEFPPYRRFQDPPFFVRAMYKAGQFYMIDEYVYKYRYFDSKEKYTINKTLDQLQGVIDNLQFSKNHNLPILHYVSAIRLNTECGYMAERNIESEQIDVIIRKLIEANALVDEKWLKEEGIICNECFVIDFFKYLIGTTIKYEKIRKKRIVSALKRLFK